MHRAARHTAGILKIASCGPLDPESRKARGSEGEGEGKSRQTGAPDRKFGEVPDRKVGAQPFPLPNGWDCGRRQATAM